MRPCTDRPVVISGECQRFFGRNYHIHKDHYFRGKVNRRWSYIHRDVWEYFSGEKVPADHVVHHEDGDRTNNQYENLICISSEDHSEHHTWRMLKDTPDEAWAEWQRLARERSAAGRAKMSPEAVAAMDAKRAAWHRSPEGRAFHRRHYQENLRSKLDAEVYQKTCRTCGVEFMGRPRAVFCLGCRGDSRKNRKRLKVCKACGVEFMGYVKRVYCSDECKAAFRSRK